MFIGFYRGFMGAKRVFHIGVDLFTETFFVGGDVKDGFAVVSLKFRNLRF